MRQERQNPSSHDVGPQQPSRDHKGRQHDRINLEDESEAEGGTTAKPHTTVGNSSAPSNMEERLRQIQAQLEEITSARTMKAGSAGLRLRPSPFVREIQEPPLLKGFVVPKMPKFEGAKDRVEHVNAYHEAMLLHVHLLEMFSIPSRKHDDRESTRTNRKMCDPARAPDRRI